jgi:LysM repeat protein
MPKSAYQLFKEGKDPSQIGNPHLRQQVMRLQQQNYQAQVNQVNANFQAGLDQGLTQAEAATTWVLPTGGNKQYTVKDGDTLPDIAKNTNSTVPDILNANPDMRAPQTGMVIKTPAFQAPTATGGGGVGLPSNAALGGTTPNPQGFNRYAAATPAQLNAYGTGGAIINNQPAPNQFLEGRGNQAKSALAQSMQPLGDWWRGVAASANDDAVARRMLKITNPTLYKQRYGNMDPNATPVQGQGAVPTGTPSSTNTPSLVGGLPGAAGISRQNLTASALRLMDKVSNPDYTPTPAEMQALLRHRLLKPNAPQANGGMNGNYSYGAMQNRKRGYGGGGRGGGGTQYAQRYNTDNNEPAFSGGGGFRGLVNWRI